MAPALAAAAPTLAGTARCSYSGGEFAVVGGNFGPYRGRDVAVRDADGIHLNVAGTAIAAKVIADELRNR